MPDRSYQKRSWDQVMVEYLDSRYVAQVFPMCDKAFCFSEHRRNTLMELDEED